jgi:N-acetylglucosaminyl-diphospho-decaprenol L-rhamnosyltransferase
MTVHVVVPVFNRLPLTQSLVACIRRQKLNQALQMWVVDDGSTDGTAEWLSEQEEIAVLKGDGSLFWGGAIDLALRELQIKAAQDDWVLLINNDTTVTEDFIQRLLDAALLHAPAVVGSVVRDEINHTRLLSVGARIDAWRFLTSDLLDQSRLQPISNSVLDVDVLSGRGVLFPLVSLSVAGGMRPHVLPHYLADYELSMRVRKSGWRLLVLSDASVYSSDEFGSTRREQSFHNKFFSIKSPLYLPALIVFWWGASNWLQRLTFPLRLTLFVFFPRLRKPQA